MKRWCEIYADGSGRIEVVFRELVAGIPDPVVYGSYVSPIAVPDEVETAYRLRGPFGNGSITRMRVVD